MTTAPADFLIWVEADRIRVRFVPARSLGRMLEGHNVGGDYQDRVIRLPRWEVRRGLRASLLHELGHYLYARQELRAKDTTEEEICDLLTWLPTIFADARNAPLLKFLGLAAEKRR